MKAQNTKRVKQDEPKTFGLVVLTTAETWSYINIGFLVVQLALYISLSATDNLEDADKTLLFPQSFLLLWDAMYILFYFLQINVARDFTTEMMWLLNVMVVDYVVLFLTVFWYEPRKNGADSLFEEYDGIRFLMYFWTMLWIVTMKVYFEADLAEVRLQEFLNSEPEEADPGKK